MPDFKIAFITSSNFPDITADDQLLANYLRQQNFIVEATPWDIGANWRLYDKIIFRSCWNYHKKPVEFSAWLAEMKTQSLPFINSLKIIEWNMHKQYLFELQAKGVEIPQAILVRQSERIELKSVMEKNGWEKVVVKPAVSAGARGTWVTSLHSLNGAQQTLDDSVQLADTIIQKFSPEVLEQGEVSLIYLNKKYSHAVVKKPKQDDFRVQTELGGTVAAFTPSPDLIQQGEKIVNKVSEPLPYARVDGVVSNGKLLLMELEVFEPSLFWKYAPQSSFKLFSDSLF
ncbi:hypothetical protein WSM22_09800 [Cytophagales bacterium WSM2-2]|nr:hypothetical protein WSM22_09800 [Cytophagales bacterium WSM2-2]